VRVVLDTNIIISGLNFKGNEREILDSSRRGVFDLYLSESILIEVARVLVRKFAWGEEEVLRISAILRSRATLVVPTVRVSAISADEADNRILECAVEARAHCLITGDRRHLLPLQEYEGIKIVTSSQFLKILRSHGRA
jgi:uncharacterized protein